MSTLKEEILTLPNQYTLSTPKIYLCKYTIASAEGKQTVEVYEELFITGVCKTDTETLVRVSSSNSQNVEWHPSSRFTDWEVIHIETPNPYGSPLFS